MMMMIIIIIITVMNMIVITCCIIIKQGHFVTLQATVLAQKKCECGWTRKPRTQQCKNAGQCGLIAGSVMALVGIDVTKSCLALAY
jgi:hypothetical protein